VNVFKIIKKHLLDNTEKIEKLLEEIDCEYVKYEQNGNLITCQLPFGKFNSKNKRAVQVKLNDSLSSTIRNQSDFPSSDLFDLISYVHFDKRGEEIKSNLNNSKNFISDICGLKHLANDAFKEDQKDSSLNWLLGIRNKRKNDVNIQPNPILPETVLNDFIPYPSYDWLMEGISYRTQKYYGVGFDLESKRITIPMRNRFGKLVGIKGRILRDEDDDRKYLYLHRFQNRMEWFNLHMAHPYILSEKRVYIFEAEKSCMKAFSNKVYNTLGIGSSEISIEQAHIIKQLGLDVEIVLCYDKGINLDDIRNQSKIFDGRKVFAMYDNNDLLGNKDSPIDRGLQVWNRLVNECIFEIKNTKPIDNNKK